MEFTSQDVIDCSSVLQNGINSPLVTEELQNIITEKVDKIKEHYKKDDVLFRKNCVEAFEYFYKERKNWELVYFVRILTEQNIFMTYNVVPEFKYLVQTYGPLTRKARSNIEE